MLFWLKLKKLARQVNNISDNVVSDNNFMNLDNNFVIIYKHLVYVLSKRLLVSMIIHE